MTGVVVHVSAVDDAVLSRYEHLLDADERAQASRFLRPDDRRLFSYGRIQRRIILARYLGLEPDRLSFTATELGKPVVANPGVPRITFNASQAGGWAAVAVVPSGDTEVGVDVECSSRQVTDSLVRACLSPREQLWLRTLQEDLQQSCFLRLWTCKEAILKSSGHGLRIDPRKIEIDPRDFTPRTVPDELAPSPRYCLSSTVMGNTGWVATCLMGPADGRIDVTFVTGST